MTTLVQISDTHFGTEVPEVVDAIKQAIAAIHPDILVLSGDITQRARRSQFTAAKAFVDGIEAKKKIVIPGNHDIPLFNPFARFLAPYANYKNAFGPRETIWCEGNLAIIGYDATSPLRHKDGKLEEKTLKRLATHARAMIPEDGVLVACAHQPLWTAWPEDISEALIDREKTAALFSEYNIDIVLSGHVHVPLVTTTQDAYPDLSRHFILSGAGTAVSSRVRPGAPNSFNVITVNDSVSIANYVFNTDSRVFAPEPAQRYIRKDSGWLVDQ